MTEAPVPSRTQQGRSTRAAVLAHGVAAALFVAAAAAAASARLLHGTGRVPDSATAARAELAPADRGESER